MALRAAVAIAVVGAAARAAGTAAAPGVLAGAIRWDAWYGESVPLPAGMPGWAVTKDLGPAQFHDRLPFFATILNESAVSFNEFEHASIMDAEIEAAVAAGLDHWAFVAYAPSDPMSAALAAYRNSTTPARAALR